MTQMLLVMQMTFNEHLKCQREQQNQQDSQLPPLEKFLKLIGLTMMGYTVAISFGKNSGR